MKNINLIELDNNAHLVQPEEFDEITLSSQALAIFTDFKKHKPLVIDADTSVTEALSLMRKSHVHLNLVVDDANELIGMISSIDLDEQRLLVFQNHGIEREQLTVKDLMIPRAKIKALRYEQLVSSSIADITELLKTNHTRHCLVVKQDTHQIRGIISASDIARRLHIPFEVESPTTFVDIFAAVNNVAMCAH